MSAIFYCDGPGCVKKERGIEISGDWSPPGDWSRNVIEETLFDACSERCMDNIVEANTPAEEETEEETESSEST